MTLSHALKPKTYGFILVEDFSLLPMTSAIEAMRMANQILGFSAYQWSTITSDGLPVKASDGLGIVADLEFSADFNDFDTIYVCAGINVKQQVNASLLQLLNRLKQQKSLILGALCTGTYLLAQADVLKGKRCTITWDHMEMFCEAFPSIEVESSLFVMDGQCTTCAGGTAPLDMMLNIIYQDFGRDISTQICEVFQTERMRDQSELQKVPLKVSLGNSHASLIDAITIMEANTEEVIDLDSLAEYAHLSRRQLERLFKKYLKDSPSRYYLKIRLNKARRLLTQTNMSITDVSLSCGFSSSSLFSKSYRNFFQVAPSNDRTQPSPI